MARRLLVSVTIVVALVAGGLLLQGAPSPGAPGSSGAQHSDSDFRVAGDGTLPDQQPSLRESGAPLSTDERGYAIDLALAILPDSARDVLGAPGGEVLTTDLPPPVEREGRRRVQVSVYDYDDDRLHQLILDLASGKVIDEHTLRGVQLPPSAAETQVALDLALAAHHPPPAFIDQFEEHTGSPLLAGEQVHVVGGAYLPDETHGDADPAGGASCGRERCVQLLIALPSGFYLSTDDFAVNLSRRTVVSLTAAGPAGQPRGGHSHG